MSDLFHSYNPSSEGHGLAHDPLKACVVPRPIGWISTLGPTNTPNLAPYSFFNLMGDTPPMCAFGSSGLKDSLANAEATGEFVYNMVSADLVDAMNRSSTTLPEDENEFEAAGLTPLASQQVKALRVGESPVQLECKVFKVVELPSGSDNRNAMVIGQIVAAHINKKFLVDGLLDLSLINPIARLGYMQYGEFGETFNLKRPKNLDDKPKRT